MSDCRRSRTCPSLLTMSSFEQYLHKGKKSESESESELKLKLKSVKITVRISSILRGQVG